MTETYQAIYDAVRSKLSNGDIGRAVSEAMNLANIGFAVDNVRMTAQDAFAEMQRPSVLYRPSLVADGNKWCALYGDDLATGITGFGDTPAQAMAAFDTAWWSEHTPDARRQEREDNAQFGVGA
jgi:hypothetical protein